MFYNCNIEKNGDMYIAQFPDMPNVLTYGNSYEEAVSMAKDALNGVIETEIEDGRKIPAPSYKGGVSIAVSPQFESIKEGLQDILAGNVSNRIVRISLKRKLISTKKISAPSISKNISWERVRAGV